MLEKEGNPESCILPAVERHSDTHILHSSQMMESCELIEDVQPLLISSYYFEDSQADQAALPTPLNTTFTINNGSLEDVQMETRTASLVDPIGGGNKKDEPKASSLSGKDEADTRPDNTAPKQVFSATNTNCYEIRTKNEVDTPVVDSMPASAAAVGDPVGQYGMTVFGSTIVEDASGHTSSRYIVAGKTVATPPFGSEGTPSPCGSLERAQAAKSGLEKRKPERREGSMVTNSKSAKMDASSSRNGLLKTKNGSINGQALSQNLPTRPPAKPSKHAEIMAKLRESIKLDKDRPKKEVKSRIGLPNPRTSIAPPTRAAEKESRYNNRASSSQANRSAAKKSAHATSPVEHEVAIGKQPTNGIVPKSGGSSRSQVADDKLSALRKQGEALKRKNSELAKGLVAFSIVIDYLSEEVISSLRRQSGQWREMSEQCSSALAISNAQVEQLTKDKEELLSEQKIYIRRLQDEHNGRLKELEATLSMKNQLEMDEVLKAHEEEIRKLRESLEAEASNERFANNMKEIESLRAVLEMKTEQNRQLQSKLKDLEKEVEEAEKMKARIALLEQKNDELKEALELKKMAEKRLAVRHGDLLKTCEREKENSKRLKMDKEQLQFQLQQMLMTQSAYETPIHRQCTTSLESSATEEEGICQGKMSQSLIQIYADCSPRHTRDRQVTVYTHEGVQKATIPEDERYCYQVRTSIKHRRVP
ncbi:hypothetical protein D918_02896 [Trichuris suis]|nr:hypothetical protein D918_02896 [Trichuris suis]